MVVSGRGRGQFPGLSRRLGSSELPLPFVSVFLWFSVVWKLIIVSGVRSSGVSESGVLGWGGGSFCGLSFWEAQGVDGHRGVRRCFPNSSSGMRGFSSCFPMVYVRIRMLAVACNKCVLAVSLSGIFSGRFGFIVM